jgi:hypothetical protein
MIFGRVRSGSHRLTQLGSDPFIEIGGRIDRNAAHELEDRPAADHSVLRQRTRGADYAMYVVQVF